MPDRIASRDLLDALDMPVLLLDDCRVVHANAPSLKLLGYHIEGQDIRLAVRHPKAVALVQTGAGGRAGLEGLSVPGSRWEMHCKPLADNMQVVSFIDLSVAVSVARAHADFVANASHELRTPLAAISGYIETLKDGRAGDDEVTRNRFLEIVGREAARIQALVEDLMSLSRIEAVKHDAPDDPLDLFAIAREVAGETLTQERVAIRCNQTEAMIAGDASQMAQVVRNLIENAFKYGAENAPVEVAIEVTATGWVSLSVHNQGQGIPAQHLPRLTERFYRADPARSRESGGTGLGLAIVKHIVERHRGRFDIFNRGGGGVTATLIIPAQ